MTWTLNTTTLSGLSPNTRLAAACHFQSRVKAVMNSQESINLVHLPLTSASVELCGVTSPKPIETANWPCSEHVPRACRGLARQFAGLATVLALSIQATACRDVAPAFGPTVPAARVNAEQLFGGIAQRFTNVQRSPKFAAARGKLGKNALTPSAIYNDTSVWTSTGPDAVRTVAVDGEFSGNRYLFTARPSAPARNEPGDSRHLMVLRKLRDDEFEWLTSVDIGAGSISAAEFAAVISALMRSAENRAPAAIRADYRASFPRTTTALGRLFSLDTLKTTRDAENGTTITLGIRLNPQRLKAAMPAFAEYLEKYSTPSRYRMMVTDKRGGRWFEMSGARNFLTLRLRSIDGHFAPLNGPARPIPADLQMQSEFSTRILLFTVGFRQLVNDLTVIAGPRERGWLVKMTREPEWRLPPTVGFLIKTPLRRPFEGQGIQVRLVLRDDPGEQSTIARRTSATVKESAILRFINRLSGTAMGDFVGKAEVEENRFNADAFNALRLDVRALLN